MTLTVKPGVDRFRRRCRRDRAARSIGRCDQTWSHRGGPKRRGVSLGFLHRQEGNACCGQDCHEDRMRRPSRCFRVRHFGARAEGKARPDWRIQRRKRRAPCRSLVTARAEARSELSKDAADRQASEPQPTEGKASGRNEGQLRLRGHAVTITPGARTQLLDDPTIRRSDDPTIRRSDDPTIRRSDDPTIRRSDDPTIRRSDDPTIRRTGRRPRLSRSQAEISGTRAGHPQGRPLTPQASRAGTSPRRPR